MDPTWATELHAGRAVTATNAWLGFHPTRPAQEAGERPAPAAGWSRRGACASGPFPSFLLRLPATCPSGAHATRRPGPAASTRATRRRFRSTCCCRSQTVGTVAAPRGVASLIAIYNGARPASRSIARDRHHEHPSRARRTLAAGRPSFSAPTPASRSARRRPVIESLSARGDVVDLVRQRAYDHGCRHGKEAGGGQRRQGVRLRHRQASPSARRRAPAGAGVPAAAGPASQDPRHGGRAAGDVAADQAPGRPAPGLLRVRRAQGPGQAQDRLRPRLRLLPLRRAPGLAGAGAGARHLPALVRSPRVRRERPAPRQDGQEHRPRHRGARRRHGARQQVLPHRLLHGRRDHVGLPQAHPAQARWRGDPGPGGQLLVVRVPGEREPGGLERAGGAGQVGRGRGAPRALAHLLVEHAEAVPGVQRHRLQPRHLLPGGHGHDPQVRPQDLRSPDAAAGGVREPAPRHDGGVRQVELEPAGAGGPVPGRRGQGAPVARRTGPDRARGDVALHQPEPAVGALPRAAHGGAPLPHGRRDGRRHPQDAHRRGRPPVI